MSRGKYLDRVLVVRNVLVVALAAVLLLPLGFNGARLSGVTLMVPQACCIGTCTTRCAQSAGTMSDCCVVSPLPGNPESAPSRANSIPKPIQAGRVHFLAGPTLASPGSAQLPSSARLALTVPFDCLCSRQI